MKPKNKNRTCPDGLSNECVVWQSGDVPVLGICNGDALSDSEYTIATKIVELFGDIDMSSIDMNCLLDTCAQKCKDTSLKAVVQVLFDNQCCLKDLIDSINGGTATVTVNLNLRCLKKFDDFGNEIPQDLNQSLQSIVNQVCQTVIDVTSLQITVKGLQDQVDAINNTPIVLPEPTITTCLTPGLRPVSQTVPLVAQSLCDFQTAIGNALDISGAISQQCSNLNSSFAGTDGWISAVNNMSQSFNNLWIVACNLRDRVASIEGTCCKVTCDDIKLGFAVQVDDTGTGIILKFTSGAGTSIPAAFTDTGSTVIFTDKNGLFYTFPLVISNNANQGPFDLTGLDLNDPITISITAILSTDGLTCEKCLTRLYTLADTSCPVCAITVSGKTGKVTITYVYGSAGSQNYQTVIIGVGQTGYVPKNATILSVTSTGDASADSQCIDLNVPPPLCYTFFWEHTSGGDSGGPLGDAYFSKITIGTLEYDIPAHDLFWYSGAYPPIIESPQKVVDWIAANVPSGIMGSPCVEIFTAEISKISFTVPSVLPAPVFEITDPTGLGVGDMIMTSTSVADSTSCTCLGT